jgi:hypothetical protein
MPFGDDDTSVEIIWTSEEIVEANMILFDYRELLDNAGIPDMDEDATANRYADQIGDTDLGFSKWANRVFNNCESRLRKVR